MYIWETKFSVGVESIDLQHKELFIFINSLLDALKRGLGAEISHQIIYDLEKYAFNHFQKEEFFFKRFNYPDAANHISEHQKFIQKIQELKANLKTGKATISFELLNFLRTWIEHHILEVDKKYSKCFVENGLK